MAVIPIGFGQATIIYSGTIIPTGAVVTLGFEHTGSGLSPGSAASDIRALWDTEVLPQQSAALQMDGVYVKYGPNATGPDGTSLGVQAGGLSGDVLASNTAALITKNTAFGGRQGKGRLFLPGVVASDVGDNNTLSGTRITALEAAFADVLTGMVAADLIPMLLHSDATAPTEITSFSVETVVATQRRRLRR